VELEVCYGRFYPAEAPRLRVRSVDGLDKHAQKDLRARIHREVERHLGRECVYEVCMVVSDLLRQHYDPSAEMPLHERMQRREAEEAEKRLAAEREGRERAERERLEEKERQMQELQRMEEKRRAAKRLGRAGPGGTLDFLPEEAAVDSAEKARGTAPDEGGRYATDFEELRVLGRGGFGSVTLPLLPVGCSSGQHIGMN